MKIIKAAAVYAAEQCLRTPRGEVYSFMATAGKVRITAKVEPEAKNEYLAVYCLGCGSQPRRLVLARQKDGTMTEVPHPAEKGEITAISYSGRILPMRIICGMTGIIGSIMTGR